MMLSVGQRRVNLPNRYCWSDDVRRAVGRINPPFVVKGALGQHMFTTRRPVFLSCCDVRVQCEGDSELELACKLVAAEHNTTHYADTRVCLEDTARIEREVDEFMCAPDDESEGSAQEEDDITIETWNQLGYNWFGKNDCVMQPSQRAQRTSDYSESYHLLLELLTSEPFLQECLQIIENTCLCRELEFSIEDGSQPSKKFRAFINRHWYPFLRSAIRMQHGLGFVVWTVRTLKTGEKIPEVLPLGTFTWVVEPEKTNRSSLRYRIQLNIEAVPFHVTEWTQPNLNVNEGSILHATVQTPLSHLIEEYKILRETMKRHHHADAWNTTARIVVANDPKEFNHAAHEKEVFETIDFLKEAIESKRKHAPTAVEEAFLSRGTTNHREVVYTLPVHHHLENVPQLKPTTDLEYLYVKFRNNICSLLGIPCEMVLADRTGQRESRGGRSTSRIFQTKMMRVCGFLKGLMEEVYEVIYKETAEFNLLAMPRLEIQGVEDLKILHEIGVLQPEHTMDISELLLGKLKKRPKKDLAAVAKPGGGVRAEQDKGGKDERSFL